MQSRKIFYGWFVVAASFAAMIALGASISLFGVFFKSLESEFGWSRSLVSSGFTVFLIGYAVSVAISGRLIDRYNPRPILLTSSFLIGAGLLLFSRMNSVDQFRFFALIAGLGSGAVFSTPISAVQRWFSDRRNATVVLTIPTSGFGVGQLVFTPLSNYFILSYGWRNAYLIVGIVLFALVLFAALVIRRSPIEEEWRNSKNLENIGGWETKRALTTLACFSIIYTACVGAIAIQIVTVHLVPHATDLGLSSTTAAASLGLMGGLIIPGRLMSGFISRQIGWQKVMGVSMFGMAASLIWLVFLNTIWMLYGFVIVFGFTWGVWGVSQWGVLSEFFGLRSVGELIGITNGISTLTSAIAPTIAGFIFDTTGSYLVAFVMITLFAFSGGLVITMVKKPSLATSAWTLH